MSQLIPVESDPLVLATTLTALERRIERGLQSFADVGSALTAIRDQDLHRVAGFDTFQDYCDARWGFTDRHARRLIDAAAVVEVLGDGPMGPVNERQARELVPLLEEGGEAIAAALEAAAANGQTVTAKRVREVVQRETTTVTVAGPARTDQDREYDKLRQQKHRLRDKIRPKVLIADDVHPWQVAADALDRLSEIRAKLLRWQDRVSVPLGSLVDELDQIAEGLRQVAFTPFGEDA